MGACLEFNQKNPSRKHEMIKYLADGFGLQRQAIVIA
jgi:hypothetical protein